MPRTCKTPVPMYEPPSAPEFPHRFTFQGTLLEYRDLVRHKAKMPEVKRGIIMGFSNAARLRLLKWFNTISWAQAGPALFITLTYPDDCAPMSPQKMSMHRWSFWQQAERFFGKPKAGMWRIEWKPRQTGKWVDSYYPHLHLMMFQTRWFHRSEINRIWRNMMEVGYIRTHVRGVTEIREAGSYVSKYVAKEVDSLVINAYLNSESVGRAYGFFHKKSIPLAEKLVVYLPDGGMESSVRERVLRDKPEFNKWGTTSFTTMGPMSKLCAAMLFSPDELADMGYRL